MIDMILFPSDYFHADIVDEELKKEFCAAKGTGLFDTALFSYDKWFNEERLILSDKICKPRKAIMRGWMMKPKQYELFCKELEKKNIFLVTSPEEYKTMHIFPNVYEYFGSDTAKMSIYPLHKQIDIKEVKKLFDRFMVKDFVKSVKGTEFPKYFDSTVTQEDFDRCMEVFYKYRGNLLTGGICIKEYLELKLYGKNTNEYRVFYANNRIISISKNSGQGNYTPTPPEAMIQKYSNLPSHYYTIDYAELTDGTWKVIEAGDGSVSGLSDCQNEEQYFRALYHAFNK